MLEWVEERLERAQTRHVSFTPAAAAAEQRQRQSSQPSGFGDERRRRAETAFASIDAQCQQDGCVSKEELSIVLREDKLAAKVLFRELDTDASGDVSMTEWLDWLSTSQTAESVLEWIEDRLRGADDAEGKARTALRSRSRPCRGPRTGSS